MKAKFTFLAPLVFALTFNLSAQTIYVDVTNTTGVEDGSELHPFNTIKEGIAAAMAGYTVMISAETYYPDSTWQGYNNVLYLKPGITLKGEGMSNTIIEGIIIDWDLSILACTLDGISFLQYHFLRGTSEGPFNQPNRIRNCRANYLDISCSPGIPVNDTTPGPNHSFIIENNDLESEGSIQFGQGSGVANNTIQNNTCGTIFISSGAGYSYLINNNDIQYGIEDNSGANFTTISNNRIYNGPIIDRSGGWAVQEDEFIENNTITCGEDAPLLQDESVKAAIIATSASVTIRNNTITCSGNLSGIHSKSGKPFHAINNTIDLDEVTVPGPNPDKAPCGILTKAGWGYITGNKIHGGEYGYLSSSDAEFFADNEIYGSYNGFSSVGREEVHHNTIHDCYNDGIICCGLKGPIHDNIIKDNAGTGIRVLSSWIDLGGGEDSCPGNNVIKGNGNFDLYIETTNALHPTLYARYNIWDHTNPDDIMLYDIRDGSDSSGLVTVDFTPIGHLGIDNLPDENLFELYPNPASSIVSLKSAVFSRQLAVVEVFDLNGRKLLEKHIPIGTEEIELDVSQLKSGIYFIQMTAENKITTKKLILK